MMAAAVAATTVAANTSLPMSVGCTPSPLSTTRTGASGWLARRTVYSAAAAEPSASTPSLRAFQSLSASCLSAAGASASSSHLASSSSGAGSAGSLHSSPLGAAFFAGAAAPPGRP